MTPCGGRSRPCVGKAFVRVPKPDTIKKIFDDFAEKHGCIIGACDASPLDESGYGSFVPFVSADIKKRTDPAAVLPGATGVIAVGVGQDSSLRAQQSNPQTLDCFGESNLAMTGHAQLSSLGTAPDYHPRVRAVLRELVTELKQHHNFKHKILVDSPNLDERAFAVRAGLGFFGRNGLVISQKFGSRFNIGLIVHDMGQPIIAGPVSEHGVNSAAQSCPPDCRLCIDACPSGAEQSGSAAFRSSLLAGREIAELAKQFPVPSKTNRSENPTGCISYLTQKKELTPEEEILLARSGQLYGCDICQNVCPFNAKHETNFVDPRIWLCMSDAAFAEKYGHTAMLWQGPAILRRNAHILNLDNIPPTT